MPTHRFIFIHTEMDVLTVVTLFVVSIVSVHGLIDYSCLHSNNWRVNRNGHTNSQFSSSKTEITTSSPYNSNTQWIVTYTGIANYDRTFTTADISALNSRPKASTDFTSKVVRQSENISLINVLM